MSWPDFALIVGACTLTIFACRTLPLLLLKGRTLPPRLVEALGYIPPAAFAALVANDLFSAQLLAGQLWPSLLSWVAAAVVVVVALKAKSLTWCIVAGVACFGLLLLLPLPV